MLSYAKWKEKNKKELKGWFKNTHQKGSFESFCKDVYALEKEIDIMEKEG